MFFPEYRARRLRRNENIRRMVRETHLHVEDLIYPMFSAFGTGIKKEIPSMPGIYQQSIEHIVAEAKEVHDLGIPAVILFGIPEHKDPVGQDAYSESGIIQETIRAIKKEVPELTVITDVCMCEYTDHGHCGVIKDGDVDNDATLKLLAAEALSHARAGADIVAPSDMMDGRVAAIREILDANGFAHIPVMSYAVKYASAYYGPFRDAADSTPQFGDRRTYQMDPANRREAFREAALDVQECADFLMVKPALAYLDILRDSRTASTCRWSPTTSPASTAWSRPPREKGWIDDDRVVMETLVGMKRAGADLIITYHAKEAARLLKG